MEIKTKYKGKRAGSWIKEAYLKEIEKGLFAVVNDDLPDTTILPDVNQTVIFVTKNQDTVTVECSKTGFDTLLDLDSEAEERYNSFMESTEKKDPVTVEEPKTEKSEVKNGSIIELKSLINKPFFVKVKAIFTSRNGAFMAVVYPLNEDKTINRLITSFVIPA